MPRNDHIAAARASSREQRKIGLQLGRSAAAAVQQAVAERRVYNGITWGETIRAAREAGLMAGEHVKIGHRRTVCYAFCVACFNGDPTYALK